MHAQNELQALATQAGRGDAAATARLRQQLEPQLERIVRCTLRSGRDTNPLARRVLDEARRVATDPREPAESLARRVARRMCESVFASLGGGTPRAWAVDTVATA